MSTDPEHQQQQQPVVDQDQQQQEQQPTEDDLAALLDDEPVQQQQQQDAAETTTTDEQQQQQQVQFVWAPTGVETEDEENPQWLPAVFWSQNEQDGTFTVSFASDLQTPYTVATCEAIESLEDPRMAHPIAAQQYQILFNSYYGEVGAAGEGEGDDEAKRLRKEEKRRKKEEKERKKQEKKEKKAAKKAEAKKKRREGEEDEDDLMPEDDEDDDDESVSSGDDDNNMMMMGAGAGGGAVDRLRRGAAGAGGRFPGGSSSGVPLAPRTALDNIAAGSSDKMRIYLAKARDLYESTRQAAVRNGERMVEFETDYLTQVKQRRIDELSVIRFLKSRVDKELLKEGQEGKSFIDNLESATSSKKKNSNNNNQNNEDGAGGVEGNNNTLKIPVPVSTRVDFINRPERVARVPPGAPPSSQFHDPLLRQVSPPRIDVERRPLALRTFGDSSSSTGLTDSTTARLYYRNPPMMQWRALRDTVTTTPADIQQVPVSGHIAREFNEPRRKLQNKTRAVTAKILGAGVQEALTQEAISNQQRQCNTQFQLFDFTAAALKAPTLQQQQQVTMQGIPSVGPSPQHLGAPTPAFSEVVGGADMSGIRSAVASEIGGASQIPVYDADDLAFNVDPQSVSRGRSEQSQISHIKSDDINNNSASRGGSQSRGQSQQSAHSSQQKTRQGSTASNTNNNNNNKAPTTWKQLAAKVISRVLTPYLHGTNGFPIIINDPDEFSSIARELTTRAYNSKLRQLGLAPELKHAPIPESEFSQQEAAHLAAAVQSYMKSRAGRRRGRSTSSSDTGTDSGIGSSYSGQGSSSAGSSRSGYTSSRGSGYSSSAPGGGGMNSNYSTVSSNSGVGGRGSAY